MEINKKYIHYITKSFLRFVFGETGASALSSQGRTFEFQRLPNIRHFCEELVTRFKGILKTGSSCDVGISLRWGEVSHPADILAWLHLFACLLVCFQVGAHPKIESPSSLGPSLDSMQTKKCFFLYRKMLRPAQRPKVTAAEVWNTSEFQSVLHSEGVQIDPEVVGRVSSRGGDTLFFSRLFLSPLAYLDTVQSPTTPSISCLLYPFIKNDSKRLSVVCFFPNTQ